jgi:tetratricopeptide (TPR) repeat protein
MTTAIEREYSFGAAARILDLPETKLRYWSQSGFVGPSLRRGPRQAYTFQDLVSVRAAKELVERGFQPAFIRKALEQVRRSLPSVDRPLTKLRVLWDGHTLGLVEDGLAFEVSGQRRFDFGLNDLAERATRVLALAGTPPEAESATKPPEPKRDAFACFREGLAKEAEGGQEAGAEECYRQALTRDPGLAAAHTNLGGLLYRRGDNGAARLEFEAALAIDPEQPEARYNLASILMQQGEIEQAASELRRVVQQSPWFADAHYNLASALERLGGKRQAALHLQRFLDLHDAEPAADVEPWLEEARARLRRLDAPTAK